MEIYKEMLIGDLIEENPNVLEILIKHGMNCQGCPGTNTETLEEAVNGHALNLDEIMSDIQKVFEEKE